MHLFRIFLVAVVIFHMFEEGIGELLDLAVVHLNVFTTEIFLHDPTVTHYDGSLGSNAVTMFLASMVCSVNAVRSSESRMS